MKISVLIFIFILMVASSSLAQKQTEQVEILFKLGVESAGRAGSTTDIDKNLGFLETAIKHFTEALKIEPRNIKILLERAKTHKTLFDYEKALADCEQALEFVSQESEPNRSDLYKIYKTKGEIYEHDDDYKRAIENYRIAMEYNPNDADLTNAVNRNRLLAGDDLSDDEFEQVMNSSIGNLRKLPEPKNVKPGIKNFLYPKPDNFYKLGLADLKKAEIAKTEESQNNFIDSANNNFSKSIEINPTFAESYFQRSKTFDDDDERRLDDINTAISLKPDFADAYLERANLLSFDDYETSLNDLSKAIELKPSNTEILLKRGELYLELFEFKKALADGEAALKKLQSGKRKSPAKLALVYVLFGKIYEKGFYLSKAIESYTTALKFDPMNEGILNDRGFIYKYIGETEKAEADFLKADSLYKPNRTGTMYIGVIPETTGEAKIKKAPIVYPEIFQVFYFQEVGGYYDGFFVDVLSREDKQKAFQNQIDMAKKIVEFNPTSELAHWKLANWYLRAEKFDEAIMEFMLLVVMNKRYEYLNNMGVALAEKGRLQNAVIQFEIAVRNGKTRIEALYNRGLCYLKLNENENAIADFSEVIKLNPDFILAYQSRAKAFRAIGKITEAEADEQKLNN